MITKPLEELDIERAKYESKLSTCNSEEEKEVLKKAYLNELKLYLFNTKQIIKDTFQTELTPFKTTSAGYDGLLRKKEGESISKKTKAEFYEEINELTQSQIYTSLNEDLKKKVDTALYILKIYYEDSLK